MELTYNDSDSHDSSVNYQGEDKVTLLFSLSAAQKLGYVSLKLSDGTIMNYTAMALHRKEERLYFWDDAIVTGVCRFSDIVATSALQKLPSLGKHLALAGLNQGMLDNMDTTHFKDLGPNKALNEALQLELVWDERAVANF